jgi:Sensors of blue-light using FAD
MPYQIVYSSRATHPMSAESLKKILTDARIGNEKHHVTGALIFTEDVFFQILEGEENVVRQLMQSIKKDSRHASVKVFYEAEVDSPAFGSWSMAYLNPSNEEIKIWSGLKGTESIDELLSHIHSNPDAFPSFLINILEILGK